MIVPVDFVNFEFCLKRFDFKKHISRFASSSAELVKEIDSQLLKVLREGWVPDPGCREWQRLQDLLFSNSTEDPIYIVAFRRARSLETSKFDSELEPKPGEIYKHRRGLTLRVLDGIPPGDREDTDRVYCEVIQRYSERPNEDELSKGFVDYEIGYRDGWRLCREFGWNKE